MPHPELERQARQQALTLARVLLGYTDAELNGDEQWSCQLPAGGGPSR